MSQVLKAKWLRRYANTQAYHDVKRYATEDAMRIGRLHTFMPGALQVACSASTSCTLALTTACSPISSRPISCCHSEQQCRASLLVVFAEGTSPAAWVRVSPAGWADANAAFIRSGGYSLSKQVARVQQPTLVVWGAQDKILPPSDAQRFAQAIPHAQASSWPEELVVECSRGRSSMLHKCKHGRQHVRRLLC